MSAKIDAFNQARNLLIRFREWRSMLGKEYRGGGGGVGRIHSASGKMEIYFQESDGSNNYHESDPAMNTYIGAAVVKHAGRILDDAEAAIMLKVRECANAARQEAERVIDECSPLEVNP